MEYSKYYSMIAVMVVLAIIAVAYYVRLQSEREKTGQLQTANNNLVADNTDLKTQLQAKLNEERDRGF